MAKLFNTLGKLGLGIAIAGGVVNSALYNGKFIIINDRIIMVYSC